MNKLKIVIAAIQYIETHLTSEKIDLDYVAAAVHYSKFHLHRIFNDTVGLTIHDYAQRRQLTEAAKLLVFSDKPIIDIAISAGFESQQAFSNAFKAMYKRSPLRFRNEEVFYPLQLEYDFKNHPAVPADDPKEVRFVTEADIPLWMDLLYMTIDGFPCLDKNEHLEALNRYMTKKSAMLMIQHGVAVGGMMISKNTGSIDFLAVHPLYRKQGIARDLLQVALGQLLENREISTTTFREGDRADTGYRKALKQLGFAEAELVTEFGYPTQRLVLPREDSHD